MLNATKKLHAGETVACCCVDIGTVIDNADCGASYCCIFANEAEAKAMLQTLTEKARLIESDPCNIKKQIKSVDGGVQLTADFVFACQAEALIFQLALREGVHNSVSGNFIF